MKKIDIKKDMGAVTFLDVLGWKGIWQQNEIAIETLYALIQMTSEEVKKISLEYSEVKEFRGKSEITKVLSISDTIALFTSGPSKIAVEIQAKICSILCHMRLSKNFRFVVL